ncbi:uncharacterized protein LOC117326671 [Pecten maximus]|uniref:uncharacterized protein LOC117326671 n=1 Tax=Pecten maximus TaxID=6579 RepID=UPI001457EF90|nr:uncharacterized protein LOC117326671 [Pecten maximus]
MPFEVNMSIPNKFLILVCDCYGMSSDRNPIFKTCLDLHTSDPFHRIATAPNQYGSVELTLNVTQHNPNKNDLSESPGTVTTEFTSTTDDSTIYTKVPLKQYKDKDTDIHTDITDSTVHTKAPSKQYKDKDTDIHTNSTGKVLYS